MTRKITAALGLVAAACLFSAILSGCGQHIDKISDLNDNPGNYLHHEVTIAGEVTEVYELPFGITNIAAYRLNDDTGQIWVVTHSGAPVKGDKVGLKGDLEPIANISVGPLGNLVGNVVEEKQRRSQ